MTEQEKKQKNSFAKSNARDEPRSLKAVFSVPTTDRKKMPVVHHLPKSHTPMISRANTHSENSIFILWSDKKATQNDYYAQNDSWLI